MAVFAEMQKKKIKVLEILPEDPKTLEARWIAKTMKRDGHEALYLICYPELKLKAAIAIHNRTLGEQALGGIRMLPYSNEIEMILDVLRLSKAMTYKSAIAEMKRGGAKCTIWGNPRKDKTIGLLLKLAEEIENLEGKYIGGEDMNIDENDIQYMYTKTSYVAGRPEAFHYGEPQGSGDPSPVTAQGVIYGMRACLTFLGMKPLFGKTVAIQGLGKVGHRLARFLYQEGVKQIIATDIDPSRLEHFKEEFRLKVLWDLREFARIVKPEEIFSQECDIFAPCAGGGILNEKTIPLLKTKIVAGAANNQLKDPACGEMLMKRGILYAPDYVINAGGLINVDDERHPDGYDKTRVQEKLKRIFKNLLRVFWYSKELDRPTNEIADMLAEEKIQVKILTTGN